MMMMMIDDDDDDDDYDYYCVFLCYPIKLSSSQPMSFFQFSSPSHCEGCNEQAAVWCRVACWS